MYQALMRDIERLTDSHERLVRECESSTRRCGELQRDLDHLRQLFRGV